MNNTQYKLILKALIQRLNTLEINENVRPHPERNKEINEIKVVINEINHLIVGGK